MVLSCTKGALHNHPPLQLSVQNLWFHQEGGWYSLLLLLLRRMLTCGYRSPLAAPLHLALQRDPIQLPRVIEGGVWINDSREFGFHISAALATVGGGVHSRVKWCEPHFALL